MSDRDFKVGDREFKLRKLDAIKQFHVARRMAPILKALLPEIAAAAKEEKAVASSGSEGVPAADPMDKVFKFLSPIMDGLSMLNDADSEYVMFALLSCVEVRMNGVWGNVCKDGVLMYSNLDLPVLLQAAGRAFVFNMESFFAALPQGSLAKG